MAKLSPASRPLNPRQSRFVDEYLRGGSAREAAEWAGYRWTAARQAGHELMKRPNVRAAIEAGVAARDNPLTRPAVLLEISRVAFANMADYVQLKDGQPSLDLSRITHARAAGFREFRYSETSRAGVSHRRLHIRLGDKLAALKLLLAHLDTHQGQAEIADMARAEAARLTAIEADSEAPAWMTVEETGERPAKNMDNVVTEPCDGPDFGVTEPCDGPDEALTVSDTALTQKPARPPYRRPRPLKEAPWVAEMRQELDRLERGLIS
ncbi:MAG: terminase small subunit [Caulobacter sp.]|nr:terminase small subunit [Caulobacter sp.]